MTPGAQQIAGPLASLDGMRVLLVEDTWIIAQSYASLLEPLGVDVIGPAGNLADANRLLDAGNIQAALVDINLQGEMAYEFIDLLRQREIPVIVVTAYETLPRLTGKAEAVLKKPIRAEHMLKALRGIATAASDAEPIRPRKLG